MGSVAAVIAGLGAYLPPDIVTNADLSRVLDTDDEWITTRTGISSRHVVDTETATSDLAVNAGRRALESAGVTDVDMVLVATTTPDRACPATAPDVAHRLGLGTVPAFDVAAACSGFIYALSIARSFILSTDLTRVLVIGADALTTITDPDDRGTRPIFADGAGAVVVRRGDASELGAILDVELHADGGMADMIATEGGGSRARAGGDDAPPYLRMDGRTTFMTAIRRMEEVSRSVLERTRWKIESVDAVVGHQANARILTALANRLRVADHGTIVNVDHAGNTSSASIPLALTFGVRTGRVQAGARVLLTSFGAGATWAAATLTWPDVSVQPYDDPVLASDAKTISVTHTAATRSEATANT